MTHASPLMAVRIVSGGSHRRCGPVAAPLTRRAIAAVDLDHRGVGQPVAAFAGYGEQRSSYVGGIDAASILNLRGGDEGVRVASSDGSRGLGYRLVDTDRQKPTGGWCWSWRAGTRLRSISLLPLAMDASSTKANSLDPVNTGIDAPYLRLPFLPNHTTNIRNRVKQLQRPPRNIGESPLPNATRLQWRRRGTARCERPSATRRGTTQHNRKFHRKAEPVNSGRHSIGAASLP